MEADTYEQFSASETVVGTAKQWLTEQAMCTVTLWNDALILVEPPNFVHLKVTETEPAVKGDTVTGGNKLATLETGATLRVPLFVNTNDILKIDTRTGEYVGRVK